MENYRQSQSQSRREGDCSQGKEGGILERLPEKSVGENVGVIAETDENGFIPQGVIFGKTEIKRISKRIQPKHQQRQAPRGKK
jgi:hypothetical protein